VFVVDRGSSVGIATGYELDGPGIESRWKRDFPHLSRTALGPTQPPVQWYRVFPKGKEQPGRDADPSLPSSAVVKKEQSYTSTPSMGRTTCTEPQCLYKGALYVCVCFMIRPSVSCCFSHIFHPLCRHFSCISCYNGPIFTTV
jgi:hypothetical protein